MSAVDGQHKMVEGDLLKRYRIVYWGEGVGDWDSAKNALKHYHSHYREVRPIINKNPKAKKDRPFYQFFDGRNEINLDALKKAAKAEEDAPTLRRTAWHEAGHAVVAWDQKLTVTLVSIKPDAKSRGRSEQTRATDHDPAQARQRENIVTMAGWAAEHASGEAADGLTYDDSDLASVLSRIPDGRIEIELGWAEQEAARIVRANVDRVERLANVLMQRIELTDADEIRAIIEG